MNPQIMEGVLTPQDIFNINVDTQARWDKITSIKNDFNVPSPNFPDYNFKNDPLNPDTQMSIYDGLFSQNPHIKEQAEAAITNSIHQNPSVKFNAGFHIDTPYDQAKMYVNKQFGFDPLRDNEQYYYENEYANKSGLGKVWDNTYKGVGRLVGGIVTKLGQTVGQLGAMIGSGIEEIIDPKGNNWMEDVAENSFTKWFEGAEETIKDDWLPVFKPSNWNEKGFWSKLFSGQYWSDDLADGAAFMGSMIVETYLMGGLGRAAGLSRLGAATITGSGNAAKLSRFALRVMTGADDLGGVGTWALTVGGESMMEASDTFKTVKQQLIEEREAGKNNYSDDQISKIAGDRAAGRFKANLVVLGISNAFENRFIYQPLMKRLRGKTTNLATEEPSVLGKGVKVSEKTNNLDDFAKAELNRPEYTGKLDRYFNIRKKLRDPLGSLNFYGSRALRATFMEGYWEENAQLAIERLSNQGHLNVSNFLNQYFKQTSNATRGKDTETADNIGAGAVIGILGSTGTSVATRERRKLKEATNQVIARYEMLRKQYLSIQDSYEKDENGNFIPNEDGVGYKINPDKAKAIIAGMDEHLSKQVTIDNIKDPIFRKFLQEQLLASYVFAAKQAGIHNSVQDRFQKLGTLSPDQLTKLGFDPSTPENLANFQQAFKEQSEIYNQVFLSKTSVRRPKDVKEKEFDQQELERKNDLYTTLTSARATKRALDDYTALAMANTIDILKSPNSIFQLHNSLFAQLMKLSEFEDTLPKESTFYNQYIKDTRKKLFDELKNTTAQLIEFQSLPENLESENPAATIDTDFYKKFFDENGKFIKELVEDKNGKIINKKRKEFFDYIALHDEANSILIHGSLQNSISQLKYLSDKISDNKNGYKNYQEYKKHQKFQKDIDDEVDEEERPQEEKNDITAEQAEIEAKKKAEEEAKLKAQQEAEKIKAEEEKKKKEEEEWRKANPKEALEKDIKAGLSEFINESGLSDQLKESLRKTLNDNDFIAKFMDTLSPHFDSLTNEEKQALLEIGEAVEEYNKLIKNPPTPQVSELEAKKADIERRRQEELKDALKTFDYHIQMWREIKEYTGQDSIGNALEAIYDIADKEGRKTRTKGSESQVDYSFTEHEQKLIDYIVNNTGRASMNDSIDETIKDEESRKKKASESRSDKNKAGRINIKYDAELAALEKKEEPVIISPEEKALENQLGKEKADEVRARIQKTIDAELVPDSLIGMAKSSPLQFLKMIAEQAQSEFDGISNRDSTNNTFGFAIVKYAEEVFPAPKKEVQEEPKIENDLSEESIEALKEAYNIANQALERNISYPEMLRELGIYQNENKIDEAVDNGKMNGLVVVPTMRPNELNSDGTLNIVDKPYLQARFNFLQRLSDIGALDSFKLVLFVDKKGNLKGKVADAEGNILKFNSDGLQSEKGVDIIFDLDLISYNNDSIEKERIEASGRKQDPLKKADKNFKVHESFGKNVDKRIIDYVTNSGKKVTAKLSLVTQGQLVRPGITNNPNSLTDLSGKRKTLAQLQNEGKVFNNENGEVAKITTNTENNTFIKSGRLNVRLRRNINNDSEGFEIVEFIPKKLSELVDKDGKKVDLKPILEKAVKGQLDSSYEVFLKNILDRRKYLILNIGNTVLVANKEKFIKKITNLDAAKSTDLLKDEILNLTSVDEILNSELNIDSSLYKDTTDFKEVAQSYPDEVASFIENYQDIIKNNVTSSASEVKVSENKQGVARVNKRLVVTLDKSFEEMKNDNLTKEVGQTSNPEETKIETGELTPNSIIKILSSDEEVNLDEALNDLNCKP
jgi:hypothetical protein